MHMKKILILGSGSAGKTTFACKLSKQLNIDVIHLDSHYWQENWQEPTKEQWNEKLKELLKQNQWIMDGHFNNTLPLRLEHADTIIFLDRGRLLCLFRWLRRVIKNIGRNRAEMPRGCIEKLDWEYIKWLWQFPRTHRPEIIELLKRHAQNKNIAIVTNNKQSNYFISTLN